MTNHLLSWQNFSLKVDQLSLLEEVSLVLRSGQIHLILGLNGCGKTMLLRNLCGLEASLAAAPLLMGRPLDDYTSKERARMISFLPQFPQVQEHMLVEEYLDLCRYAFDEKNTKNIGEDFYHQLELDSLVDKSLGILSGGELKKVALMGCLLQEPKVLLLDEPFQHLDPHHKAVFCDIFRQLKKSDVAMIMTSHDFTWSLPLADTISGFCHRKLIEGKGVDFMEKIFSYPFRLNDEGHPCPVIKEYGP